MNEQELKELCATVVRRGRTYADEKQVIAKEAEARGISLNPKCANCYVDAAYIIYTQLQEETEAETEAAETEAAENKYVLKKGVDVLFGGVRICAATLTDKMAENIVARGFSVKFFAKYPQS